MVQVHGIRRASADAKYRQMTGQPVKPLILRLCLPAVISNLVTTAYNLTDTFFIGQLGTAQSGAIGIAFSIMTVMQALGFFFGNGAGNSMASTEIVDKPDYTFQTDNLINVRKSTEDESPAPRWSGGSCPR